MYVLPVHRSTVLLALLKVPAICTDSVCVCLCVCVYTHTHTQTHTYTCHQLRVTWPLRTDGTCVAVNVHRTSHCRANNLPISDPYVQFSRSVSMSACKCLTAFLSLILLHVKTETCVVTEILMRVLVCGCLYPPLRNGPFRGRYVSYSDNSLMMAV